MNEALRVRWNGVVRNIRDFRPFLVVFGHFDVVGVGAVAVPVEDHAGGVDFGNLLHINGNPRGALVGVPSIRLADLAVGQAVGRVMLFLLRTSRDGLSEQEVRASGFRLLAG